MQAGRNNQGLATILFKKVKAKWVNPNFPSTFLLIPTNVHAAVLELQERDKKQTKGMKHIKTTVIFYNKKKKNKQFTKKRIDNKPGTLVLGSDHAASTGRSGNPAGCCAQGHQCLRAGTGVDQAVGLLLGIPSPAEISQLFTAQPWRDGFCSQGCCAK